MALTDTAIRTAKPRDKIYRLADAQGLCLEVTTAGRKLWRLRYRLEGKAKMLRFRAYPSVTLAQARERRDAARPNWPDRSAIYECPHTARTQSVQP